MKNSVQSNNQKGFTLIELLVVIAVIGVLATIVLAAINPLEQLKRGRDASRIAAVTQLGHAWTNWATSQASATFPIAATGWQTATLTPAKELSQEILAPANTPACGAAINQESTTLSGGNGVCYSQSPIGSPVAAGANAVVWEMLESQSNYSKWLTAQGGSTACASGQLAVVYSTQQGKSGLDCLSSTTAVPSSGDILY